MYHSSCIFLLVMQIALIVGYIPVQASNEFSRISATDLQEPAPKAEQLRRITLEELVKTNSEAYTIWNITHKYNVYDQNKTTETCISELQINRKLIPVYMVNITFKRTETFVEDYMRDEFKDYNGNELKYARKIYENRTQIISDMEKYFSISKNVSRVNGNEDDSKGLICISSSVCGCIEASNFQTFDTELEVFKDDTNHLWDFIVFGSYVDPAFRIIIIFAGLILNCVLLYIFYKEDLVRSESYVMQFNLAIANIFMLIFFIPTNYVGSYHLQDYDSDMNAVFLAIQIFVVSANTLTTLLLNFQHYFDVCRVLDRGEVKCKLTSTSRSIGYSAVLWVWSTLMALLYGLLSPKASYILKTVLYYLLYLFVFATVLVILNSMTARKLQRSAVQGSTVNDIKHIVGSGVVVFLTATYFATHFPFFIFITYDSFVHWMYLDLYISSIARIIIFTIHVMFLLYPCINVLVLYKASSTYRFLLNKYLFFCWYDPQERQYLTMISVQSTESRE